MALQSNANVDCKLLFENDDYLFLEKGPRVHSVALSFEDNDTVANWLISLNPQFSKIGKPLESGLLHRLDYETSGVMVAAKNQQSWEWLKKLFQSSQVTKEYVCLTHQKPPAIGVYQATADAHPKSSKRVVIHPNKYKNPITTQITSIKKEKDFYRVGIKLVTGFRHQIRAHLAYLGCPLVGDQIYRGIEVQRLMLHAHMIGFSNKAGHAIEINSNIPF